MKACLKFNLCAVFELLNHFVENYLLQLELEFSKLFAHCQ